MTDSDQKTLTQIKLSWDERVKHLIKELGTLGLQLEESGHQLARDSLQLNIAAAPVRNARSLVEAAWFVLFPEQDWKKEAVTITNASNAIYTVPDPNAPDHREWQGKDSKIHAMEIVQRLWQCESQIHLLVDQLLDDHKNYEAVDFTDAHGLLKSARNQMLIAQQEPWRYLQKWLIPVPSQMDKAALPATLGEA